MDGDEDVMAPAKVGAQGHRRGGRRKRWAEMVENGRSFLPSSVGEKEQKRLRDDDPGWSPELFAVGKMEAQSFDT